jgi:methionyl-tRNA formyltransferase
MASPIRLVFLGSDAIALPLLDWLATTGSAQARIVGVFTGPDRPAGRGQQVRPNPVKAWTEGRGFPVLQPEKVDEAAREQLAELAPDVSLVVAYGQILRDPFILTPRFGTWNLHASLLPRYRGASPIQTAVACGERETGMTLMRIVRELDAGPVAEVERVPIGPLDTAREVEARMAAACLPLLARALPTVGRGGLVFRDQDPAAVSYCRRLDKEDGGLDFAAPAPALAARINGLFPWPCAFVAVAGQIVKLGLAEAVGPGEAADGEVAPGPIGVLPAAAIGAPGTVMGADARGLRVATGAGVLRLLRLQRPGGRMLDAPEFLRGFPLPVGTRFPSVPMTTLTAATPFRR